MQIVQTLFKKIAAITQANAITYIHLRLLLTDYSFISNISLELMPQCINPFGSRFAQKCPVIRQVVVACAKVFCSLRWFCSSALNVFSEF